MYLGKSTSMGVSIKFPWELKKQFTPEEMATTIHLIRTGSPQEKEVATKEMIEAHLRLSLKIASRYAAMYPSLVDDYVSAAFEAVTIAVQKLIENDNYDGVATYIGHYVNRYCADVIRLNHVIKLPERRKVDEMDISYLQYHESSKFVEQGDESNQLDTRPTLNLANNNYMAIEELHGFIQMGASQEDTDEDVKYALSKILTTPNEMVCVSLAEKGFNYEEIGEKLGLTKGRISQIFSGIKEKYDKLVKLPTGGEMVLV